MYKLKLLLAQSTMICTGILFIVGTEGVYYHLIDDEMTLMWYHPFSFILAGILGALPTLLFSTNKEPSRTSMRVRWVLHFLLLFAVISLMGYIFNWYRTLTGYAFVAVGFVMIYAAVVTVSLIFIRHEESQINDALDSVRDED